MNSEITKELHERGADIVRFVDISELPDVQTQGFSKAIVVSMVLSRKFINDKLSDEPTEHDEFVHKEHETDELADWLAEHLKRKGYNAYSQSEKSNEKSGHYDTYTRSSTLPHKTVAVIGGMGFIGKNNLLVTKDYGCALCMCTVLTDAPVIVEKYQIILPECGECDICRGICPSNAIKGHEWKRDMKREDIIDVFKCTCPLKCMVHCPWTIKYAKNMRKTPI